MGARLGRRARADAPAAPSAGPAPYERRVRWLREIQSTLRERRPERARQLLRLLRQARERAGRPGIGDVREGPGLQARGVGAFLAARVLQALRFLPGGRVRIKVKGQVDCLL